MGEGLAGLEVGDGLFFEGEELARLAVGNGCFWEGDLGTSGRVEEGSDTMFGKKVLEPMKGMSEKKVMEEIKQWRKLERVLGNIKGLSKNREHQKAREVGLMGCGYDWVGESQMMFFPLFLPLNLPLSQGLFPPEFSNSCPGSEGTFKESVSKTIPSFRARALTYLIEG
ncbi:hypothetical protein HAX54_045194 [Datura stramonium]|uniref:Uncharacterized protein n=1 Tax=Datura stramonium TaxID=4076 RepID=A0ABS8SQ41_DATST|nr:hypothetical protein [Datura stramonium]